ncbi:MAG TPA: VWA domain-containing protein [Baekduia sp.]
MSIAVPLWLLAAIPIALLAAGALRRPSERAPTLLRAAAALALVLALAQPHAGAHHAPPTLLLLDRSASTDATMVAREDAWVRAAVRQHACAAPCRVIAFATTAAFSDQPGTAAAQSLDPAGTDLGAALRLALGALPGGGRAVVLSDGHASRGDADAQASAARRAGVHVDAVPLTPAPTATDAAVTRFTAPSPVRSGDALPLSATVRSTVARTATLTLARDGAPIGRRRITLRRGDNPFFLTYRAPAAGWHAYRLAIALDGDTTAANDALDATARVGDAPRALVIEGTPGRAGALPAVLRRNGLAVTTTTPSAWPSPVTLATADLVVLADIPATALPTSGVTALRTAVRGGTGLFVLGGPHSLSLGGYAGTPLDAMLPVQSLTPGGVRRRQLALELVLDRSSSMADLATSGQDTKIALARAAAQSALALTARDEDELGLVAFDATARVSVPLQRVTPGSSAAVAAQIDRLDADGGTNILLGLQRGIAQAEQGTAKVKHIILMSDGVSEPGDYGPALARLRRDRITLSTIALGPDADATLLRRLARDAGGRFVAVPDAAQLPRVLAQEVRSSAPSVGFRGRAAVRLADPSPLASDLSGTPLPALGGAVVTRLRPGATAALTTTVDGTTVPVLAHWQDGLGRVAVWTPGAGDWAGAWATGHPATLAATARWTARALATPALTPTSDPADPSRVIVDPLATAGTTLDLADLAATVRTPAGATRPLPFTQIAPSRYAASLGGPGVYGLGVRTPGTTTAQALIAVPYNAELRPQPADTSVLGTLARATDGRILNPAAPDAALRPDDGTALWRAFAVAALLLLLADVAAGRRALTPRG